MALVALSAACSSGADDSASDDATIEPLVESTTRVVDARPGVDVDVKDDSLVFHAPLRDDVAKAAIGDVLVSGHGEGFCRRIVARRDEGDHVVIMTERAAVTDVFRQARIQGPQAEASLTPQSFSLPIPTLGIAGVRLPLSGTGDGSEITIEEGSFSLKPNVDFDVTVRDRRLSKMRLVVNAPSSSKLKVKYHINRPAYVGSGVQIHFGEPGKKIAEAPPHYGLIWVGGVPVVIVVKVELLVGFLLEVGGDVSGETSFTSNGTASAGVTYDDGGWHDVANSNLNLAIDGSPSFASTSLGGDVTLTAKLAVSLYDVAGPWVGLQAYAGLGRDSGAAAQKGNADIYGEIGLRGLAGVEAAPFGKMIVGYQSVLFDKNLHFPIVASP
jgi:hypothetical protein